MKTGSITRLEARAAALAVKAASAKHGGNARGVAISPVLLERILGHFGTGPARPGAKKITFVRKPSAKTSSAPKKRFVKKTTANKASSKRLARKAS